MKKYISLLVGLLFCFGCLLSPAFATEPVSEPTPTMDPILSAEFVIVTSIDFNEEERHDEATYVITNDFENAVNRMSEDVIVLNTSCLTAELVDIRAEFEMGKHDLITLCGKNPAAFYLLLYNKMPPKESL